MKATCSALPTRVSAPALVIALVLVLGGCSEPPAETTDSATAEPPPWTPWRRPWRA